MTVARGRERVSRFGASNRRGSSMEEIRETVVVLRRATFRARFLASAFVADPRHEASPYMVSTDLSNSNLARHVIKRSLAQPRRSNPRAKLDPGSLCIFLCEIL